MSRLSPAALLIVGAFIVPVFVELPVVLSMVGVDLPMSVSLGLGAVAFAAVLVWSEISEPGDSSTEA